MSDTLDSDTLDSDNLDFVDVDGTRTRYYEAGSGPPLLLIHGGQFGQTYAIGSWSRNLAPLAEHFHVYALEKLGQGYTALPERDDAFTFDAVCEHARAFIRRLDIDRPHVVGHSRGGLVAAWLGLEHGDAVESVTIVDSNTTAPVDSEKGFAFYARLEEKRPDGPPSMETVRVEPEANSYGTEHVTEAFLRRKLDIARLDKTREATERMERLNESQFLPSVDRVRDDALERIASEGLPVPTLVLWGFDDPSAPVDWGVDLFEVVAGETDEAEFHVLNRAGHYSFRERPRAFNRTLRAFCLD